jgi:hypothetical protein
MIKTGTYECTIEELADDYDYLLNITPFGGGDHIYSNKLRKRVKREGEPARGFTIGKRGKTIFWYIIPTPNGCYKCYPTDERGNIYTPRYYDPRTKITIHYQ